MYTAKLMDLKNKQKMYFMATVKGVNFSQLLPSAEAVK